MNNRNFWSVLGLGALGIALLALPGASAKKQGDRKHIANSTPNLRQPGKRSSASGNRTMVIEIEGLPSMPRSRFCWVERNG